MFCPYQFFLIFSIITDWIWIPSVCKGNNTPKRKVKIDKISVAVHDKIDKIRNENWVG